MVDASQTWRIIYRVDPDAVVIAEVFSKKTASTPTAVIELARTRLRHYDDAVKG
jgi:phage-related protein